MGEAGLVETDARSGDAGARLTVLARRERRGLLTGAERIELAAWRGDGRRVAKVLDALIERVMGEAFAQGEGAEDEARAWLDDLLGQDGAGRAAPGELDARDRTAAAGRALTIRQAALEGLVRLGRPCSVRELTEALEGGLLGPGALAREPRVGTVRAALGHLADEGAIVSPGRAPGRGGPLLWEPVQAAEVGRSAVT